MNHSLGVLTQMLRGTERSNRISTRSKYSTIYGYAGNRIRFHLGTVSIITIHTVPVDLTCGDLMVDSIQYGWAIEAAHEKRTKTRCT